MKGLAVISHFEVARETGLMLCRSALRDCFEDANTFSLTVAQVSLHLARLWKQPYDKCHYLHMLYSLVSCICLFYLLLFYQEAITAESFVESTPMCIEKGDLERGFADSDHVLHGEMRMGGQVCLLRLKIKIAQYLINGT